MPYPSCNFLPSSIFVKDGYLDQSAEKEVCQYVGLFTFFIYRPTLKKPTVGPWMWVSNSHRRLTCLPQFVCLPLHFHLVPLPFPLSFHCPIPLQLCHQRNLLLYKLSSLPNDWNKPCVSWKRVSWWPLGWGWPQEVQPTFRGWLLSTFGGVAVVIAGV